VPDVKQVEAAVGERDRAACGAILRHEPDELFAADDRQWPLRTASLSSFAVTVAVPRFMTTMPPA
jgi:hypothetical protein